MNNNFPVCFHFLWRKEKQIGFFFRFGIALKEVFKEKNLEREGEEERNREKEREIEKKLEGGKKG